jgi:phage host-nuclease inhibitor protein Gam
MLFAVLKTDLPPIPPIASLEEASAEIALMNLTNLALEAERTLQKSEISLAKKRDNEINNLGVLILGYRDRLQVWSAATRKDWGESKSLEMAQGTVGFRMSNRSLILLKGWTWDLALAKIRVLKKKFGAIYVREKFEVDRQLILAHSRTEVAKLAEKDLKKIGVQVWQEETFFVELAGEAPVPILKMERKAGA